MGFFEPPQLIEAEVIASVPDKLRKRGAPSSWVDANHPGSKLDCFLTHCFSESFKGVNDLTFAQNGDLYFTDQGQTGIHDPTGRVYRYTADGRLECLIANGPSPNGLAMDEAGNLSAAHARPGIIWLLSPVGEPLNRVQSRTKGSRMTNMTYGGADRKTLYITDSCHGAILAAKMPVAGTEPFSHSQNEA